MLSTTISTYISRNAFEIRYYELSKFSWWVWNPHRCCKWSLTRHRFIPRVADPERWPFVWNATSAPPVFRFLLARPSKKPWLFRICCLFSQSLNVLEKSPHRKRLTVQNLYVMLSASFNSNWRVYMHAVSFLQPAPDYFKSRLFWIFVYHFPKVINSHYAWRSAATLRGLDI